MKATPRRRLLLWAGSLLGLSVGGAWLDSRWPGVAPELSPVDAAPLPEFSLVDQDGAPFGADALRGGWNVVFFGFTQCAAICPLTLQQLVKVRGQLQAQAVSPLPRVVLVSVDPEQDTPQRMKSYLASFDTAFVGVTGDAEQVARLERWLGAAHRAADGEPIEHSGYLYLIDPEGRLRARIQSVDEADAITASIARWLRAPSAAGTCHDERRKV